MGATLDPLIADFLAWIDAAPRPYAEVMDVWRTSCPRLTVWEDAVDAGLVARGREAETGVLIGLTSAGRARLQAARARDLPAGRRHA